MLRNYLIEVQQSSRAEVKAKAQSLEEAIDIARRKSVSQLGLTTCNMSYTVLGQRARPGRPS